MGNHHCLRENRTVVFDFMNAATASAQCTYQMLNFWINVKTEISILIDLSTFVLVKLVKIKRIALECLCVFSTLLWTR